MFTNVDYHKNILQNIFEVIPISYVDQATECVVCHRPFGEDDDVVFCPQCGAPHHRACFQEQGHCFYESAHGTDLEWRPKQEQPKEEPPAQNTPQMVFYVNGFAMVRCPACHKITRVYKEDTTCNHCGAPVHGVADLPDPLTANFAPLAEEEAEPIDGYAAKKFAKMVVQKRGYYLPRFRQLKGQGNRVVSWNWAAFLLSPYWLAFRKCYVWAMFAVCFDLLSAVLMVPFFAQASPYLEQGYQAYMQSAPQLAAELSGWSLLFAFLALMVLVIRAVIFGLFGNYIYKKECIRRIQRLDALPPDEANLLALRLGGVNVFMPLVFYYLINILKNLIFGFLA